MVVAAAVFFFLGSVIVVVVVKKRRERFGNIDVWTLNGSRTTTTISVGFFFLFCCSVYRFGFLGVGRLEILEILEMRDGKEKKDFLV